MDTRDLVWDMFCKSGNIGDYMLYNELTKNKESFSDEYTKDKGINSSQCELR